MCVIWTKTNREYPLKGKHCDAFGAIGKSVAMLGDYFPPGQSASYLLQSSDADKRVFLVNRGEKYYVNTPDKLNVLGHGTRGVWLTTLDPSAMSSIPTNNTAFNPLLVRRQNDPATKLLIGAGLLAFLDSPTLGAWVGGGSQFVLSDSIYNSVSMAGLASRLVRSASGRVYFIENGTKRWISSYSTFVAGGYAGYPLIQIPGYSLNLIPNGADIN